MKSISVRESAGWAWLTTRQNINISRRRWRGKVYVRIALTGDLTSRAGMTVGTARKLFAAGLQICDEIEKDKQ